MDRTSDYGSENVGSNPMVGGLIKYGPEEKLADSPACLEKQLVKILRKEVLWKEN